MADMPRAHGYSPRGRPCHGAQDWHARGRVNVPGAWLAGVLLSIGLTTNHVDADLFGLWPERDQMPKLPAASVLVMANACFHRRADTPKSIASNGHVLEYLPPYSPDRNKIEQKWVHAKAKRRKTGSFCQRAVSEANLSPQAIIA